MEFDNKMRDNTSGFITVETLTKINGELEKKMHRAIDGMEKKVDDINQEFKSMDIKVDNLKDIVVPLAVNFEYLVRSSEKTNVILEQQVKEQRLTNGLMGEKIQNQDVEMVRINNKLDAQASKKASRTMIVVALITIIPAIVVLYN